MPKKIKITCIYCSSAKIKKIGKRINKHQSIQRYKCNDCNKTFITKDKNIKNKTYPPKIILSAVSLYNPGHTQEQTSKIIAKKHKIKVPQKTISNWFNEYKPLTPYHKLRFQATKLPLTNFKAAWFDENNYYEFYPLHAVYKRRN